MALLYDRVLRHRQIIVNKSDTTWNWFFNTPCKSLKGILVLFEEEKSYVRDMSKFYNPKIQKVSVIVEGKPNQLYAQGMRLFEQYDETRKYFAEGVQRDNDANEVQAQLQLHDLSVGECLCLSQFQLGTPPSGNLRENFLSELILATWAIFLSNSLLWGKK